MLEKTPEAQRGYDLYVQRVVQPMRDEIDGLIEVVPGTLAETLGFEIVEEIEDGIV